MLLSGAHDLAAEIRGRLSEAPRTVKTNHHVRFFFIVIERFADSAAADARKREKIIFKIDYFL